MIKFLHENSHQFAFDDHSHQKLTTWNSIFDVLVTDSPFSTIYWDISPLSIVKF